MPRKLQPRELTKRMREVLEYAFAHPGASQKEIGTHFGISPQRVSEIFKSKRVLDAFPAIARYKRQMLIPKAVKVEEQLLDSENDEVRRKVVERVYTDHKISDPVPNTQINVFQAMPNDQLQRILDVNRLNGAEIIDATVVEESNTGTDGQVA